jgi:hypothetical protein
MYTAQILTHKIRDRCYDFKKIFAEKNCEKKLAFLTPNKAKLCKIMIITLVYEKNANFFAEICQKSPKIVIITSTPDMPLTNVDAETTVRGKKRTLNFGYT